MNRYRYYIDGIEVLPINAGAEEYSFKKQSEGSNFFDFTLNSKLIFNTQDSAFNFNTALTNNFCKEYEILIIRRIDGELQWRGYFLIKEGIFNYKKCLYEIKPRSRQVIIDDVQVNILSEPNRLYEGSVYGVTIDPLPATFENGRYFDKVVLYVAQKSNDRIVKIISNFFQINPDVVSADVFPGVVNRFTKMAFFALSDIRYPVPSDFATKAEISFKELMNDLKALFDVEYTIDSNYNLRIEHSTYFTNYSLPFEIDLTNEIYKNKTYNSDEFSFSNDSDVRSEFWSFVDTKDYTKLYYNGPKPKKDANEKKISTTKIRTETTVLENTTSKDGLFLFATDGGSFASYWIMLGGGQVNNIYLTPDYLVRNIQNYNRPGKYAVFESKEGSYADSIDGPKIYVGSLENNSTLNKRIESEIKFTECNLSLESSLSKAIRTKNGKGFIKEATFSAKNSEITCSVEYKIDYGCSFMPSDLPGLRLWLKHNEGITLETGNNNVVQWNDASGNALHAAQSVSDNRPIKDSDGGIIFTSSPVTFLSTPAFQVFPNKRGTIIIAHERNSNAINLLSSYDGGSGNFYDITCANSSEFPEFVDYVSYTESIVYPTRNGKIKVGKLILTIKRDADANIISYLNTFGAINNPVNIANQLPTVKPMIIGENPDLLSGSGGEVKLFEVLVFDRALSDTEINNINFYLIQKGLF